MGSVGARLERQIQTDCLHTDIGDYSTYWQRISLFRPIIEPSRKDNPPSLSPVELPEQTGHSTLLTLFGNFRHLRIVRAAAQQFSICWVPVRCRASSRAIRRIFWRCLPSIRVLQRQRNKQSYVEADRFQRVNAHQAKIQFFFSSRRLTVTVLPLTVWVPSPEGASSWSFRSVHRNSWRSLRTFLDLLVGDDIVKHNRRIVTILRMI